MSAQIELEEKPLSEFLRIPDILFNEVAMSAYAGRELEYLVSVRYQGADVNVKVVRLGQVDVITTRDEKLNKYSRNTEARDRAVERVFQQAASGTPVMVTTTSGWRGGRAVVLVRADMNG